MEYATPFTLHSAEAVPVTVPGAAGTDFKASVLAVLEPEAFTAFTNWETSTGLDHSQWMCGETMEAGIRETIQEEFTIYPNPSNGEFSFQFSDNNDHSIEIRDISGKLILQQTILSKQSIELVNNPKGMYFVTIDNRKIEKNHAKEG